MAVLFSGCTKPDTKLAAENADLKARLQKLEQQLQETKSQAAAQSKVPQGIDPASVQALSGQLDEAQKKAAAAATESQSLRSQLASQKAKIDQLTRDLAAAQQARDKAEQALKQYLDKTAAAIQQFKALRSTLDGQTARLNNYHQNFLATQRSVNNLLSTMPDSQIRRQILGVLGQFAKIDGTWETADQEMQTRMKEAKADYDKFVYAGGLGPNQHLIDIGNKRLLEPAEKANEAVAAQRDQQMVSSVKSIDQGIGSLQAFLAGQKAS